MSSQLLQSIRDKKLQMLLLNWWKTLEDNRGIRAELRRAKTPFDVYVSNAFRRGLVSFLEGKGIELEEKELERLALPVGVLAHAKEVTFSSSKDKRFAHLLASEEQGKENVCDVRFRRLLSVDPANRDDLYIMLIRLVRMTGGKIILNGFVSGACFWNDKTKRIWAQDYYSKK